MIELVVNKVIALLKQTGVTVDQLISGLAPYAEVEKDLIQEKSENEAKMKVAEEQQSAKHVEYFGIPNESQSEPQKTPLEEATKVSETKDTTETDKSVKTEEKGQKQEEAKKPTQNSK
jgi:hypothetical protein